MAFIGGGQEPRIEATKSEKRSGRGGVLTEHAFYTLFSLSMHTSSRHSAQTLLARSLWLRVAKVQESRENVIHTCFILMAHPVVCG